MSPTHTRRTFPDGFRNVKQQGDFDYALANFLDRFKKNPSLEMLCEEPPILRKTLNDEGLPDSFAAAAHLCQLHNLPFPDWVNQPTRRMKDPWFAPQSHNLRLTSSKSLQEVVATESIQQRSMRRRMRSKSLANGILNMLAADTNIFVQAADPHSVSHNEAIHLIES